MGRVSYIFNSQPQNPGAGGRGTETSILKKVASHCSWLAETQVFLWVSGEGREARMLVGDADAASDPPAGG